MRKIKKLLMTFGLASTLAVGVAIGVTQPNDRPGRVDAVDELSYATYKVATSSSVTTTNAPANSSATFKNTYSTAEQMTSSQSQTLTLSGYDGYLIDSLELSMKSNKKSGSGSLSIYVDDTIDKAHSFSSVAFSDAKWNGKYSTKYSSITKSNLGIEIGTNQTFKVQISCTNNSLYNEYFKIGYKKSLPDSPLDHISVTLVNPDAKFKKGDKIEKSLFKVTAVFEDKTQKDLSETEYTITNTETIFNNANTIINFSTTINNVTKTFGLPISVGQPTEIVASIDWKSVTYYPNCDWDLSKLETKLQFDNNLYIDIANEVIVTISDAQTGIEYTKTPEKSKDIKIICKLNKFGQTFEKTLNLTSNDYTINPIQAVELNWTGEKTTFAVGEQFDLSSLITIKLNYGNPIETTLADDKINIYLKKDNESEFTLIEDKATFVFDLLKNGCSLKIEYNDEANGLKADKIIANVAVATIATIELSKLNYVTSSDDLSIEADAGEYGKIKFTRPTTGYALPKIESNSIKMYKKSGIEFIACNGYSVEGFSMDFTGCNFGNDKSGHMIVINNSYKKDTSEGGNISKIALLYKDLLDDFEKNYLFKDDPNISNPEMQDTGACKGPEGRFILAKNALKDIETNSPGAIKRFKTSSDFDISRARYERWAFFNGQSVAQAYWEVDVSPAGNILNQANVAIIVVSATVILSVSTIALFVISKHKKPQNKK